MLKVLGLTTLLVLGSCSAFHTGKQCSRDSKSCCKKDKCAKSKKCDGKKCDRKKKNKS